MREATDTLEPVRLSREAGFSLLEVMIATTLLAMLTFGVLGTLVVGFDTDRSTQDVVRCQQYAQEVLETMKSVPYTQLPALSGTTSQSGDYTAQIAVSTLASGLLRIEVDVTHATDPSVTTSVVTLVAELD